MLDTKFFTPQFKIFNKKKGELKKDISLAEWHNHKLNDVFEDNNYIFLPFVGRLDISANRIFVGDILSINGKNSTGKNFETYYAVIELLGLGCEPFDILPAESNFVNTYEKMGCIFKIVGNIFESDLELVFQCKNIDMVKRFISHQNKRSSTPNS